MNQKIIENNKLIAEFMGVYPEEKSNGYWYHGVDLRSAGLPFYLGIMGNGTDNPPFYSNWDWLMPVIKKIREIINTELDISDFDEVRNYENNLNPYDYAIEQIYLSVMEFIKWYNQKQ